MKKQSQLLALHLVCFATFSLVAPADIGTKGTMAEACVSSSDALRRLCQIVDHYFKEPQDSFVHLGDEYYLVSAPNTGRVGQGTYVANIRTEEIKQFGGYGLPGLGDILQGTDSSIHILLSASSMSHGSYWEIGEILHLRKNPITGTPYIISEAVRSLVDASEELEADCMRPDSARHPRCAEKDRWGKETLHMTRQEIDHLVKGSGSLDRHLTIRILKAHAEALQIYKSNEKITSTPFQLMEDAGVYRIIDRRPDGLSLHQYINLLNDYALFAYQYGEGRAELAIEILHKVIKLSPEHKVAYLNLSEALKYASKYPSMPIGPETVSLLKAKAAYYRAK